MGRGREGGRHPAPPSPLSHMPHPANTSAAPAPAPLVVGEHVLAVVNPEQPKPPVDAVVIELDAHYHAAAREFERARQLEADALSLHRPAPDHRLHEPPVLDLTEDDNHPQYDVDMHPERVLATPLHLPAEDTVDLTAVDTIDLERDDYLHAMMPVKEEPVSTSKILFREAGGGRADRGKLQTPKQSPLPHSAKSPARPSPSRSKRRRTQEVGMPEGIEAYAESTQIKPSAAPAPHLIDVGLVYVHFSGFDRRCDRWVPAAELERASASSVAAAASGVVENTLVDNAVQAEFAGAETQKQVRKLTRARRRLYEEMNPVSERDMGNETLARMELAREESTKVRNISSIVFGDYHVDAWYFSPYPGRYENAKTLYICKFCLIYVRTSERYTRHCSTCTWRHPPGCLIYRDERTNVEVYEVDGMVNMLYCQRLCLLGKLFLDHKTLYFDVAPFLFYVVTLGDELAGFFSKEKPITGSDFNLACILTLPQHQRKGVGRFLISLSYELTKCEGDGKTGSPERPLSDLGQVSYRGYWAYAVLKYLRRREGVPGISAKDVSEATGIRNADVVSTLKSMNLVHIWKGETNADSSPKALDAAEKRTSKPRLPLVVSELRRRFKSQGRGDSVVGDDNVRTPKSQPKRPRQSSAKVTPTISKPPKSALRKPNRGFTSQQVRVMSAFVRKHTPRKVYAPLNTPGGMSPDVTRKLADELGLTFERVRKKIRNLALGCLYSNGGLPRSCSAPTQKMLSKAMNGVCYDRHDQVRMDVEDGSQSCAQGSHEGVMHGMPIHENGGDRFLHSSPQALEAFRRGSAADSSVRESSVKKEGASSPTRTRRLENEEVEEVVVIGSDDSSR